MEREANFFVALNAHFQEYFKTATEYCIVCLEKQPSHHCLRVRPCEKFFCRFRFEEVLAPVATMLRSPTLCAVHLSMGIAASNSVGSIYFEPFPPHFLKLREIRGRCGMFDEEFNLRSKRTEAQNTIHSENDAHSLSNENRRDVELRAATRAIEEINIGTLLQCSDEAAVKTYLHNIEHPGCTTEDVYKLLQFVLATAPMSMTQLQGEDRLFVARNHGRSGARELLPGLHFIITDSTPDLDKLRAQKHTRVAFHGSPMSRWYSIIRNGLRDLSDTALMTSGAQYGRGVYVSTVLSIAQKYCGGLYTMPFHVEKDAHSAKETENYLNAGTTRGTSMQFEVVAIVEYAADAIRAERWMNLVEGDIVVVSDDAAFLRYLLLLPSVQLPIDIAQLNILEHLDRMKLS
eukprot:GEMP01033606.1.p1 GENE.GEMP01033606.1~~GEMP01033606.1.p1  ORF type:complete len:403 (+),score=83.19 GEMP01033606.1:793-2001(+)